MEKSKANWKGSDDDEIVEPKLPSDKPGFKVALPRQSIRTFLIEYSVMADVFLA